MIDFFCASGTLEDIEAQIDALIPLRIAGVSSVLFSIAEDMAMLGRITEGLMPRFVDRG